MKVKPDKLPPRIIGYRDYKNFESKAFNKKLQVSLTHFDMNNSSFNELKTIFMELLNKVALLKTKYLRANYSEFMTKELSKAILRMLSISMRIILVLLQSKNFKRSKRRTLRNL